MYAPLVGSSRGTASVRQLCASLAALAALSFASPGAAQTVDPAVQSAMRSYYRGEQREGYVFMAIGAAGIVKQRMVHKWFALP